MSPFPNFTISAGNYARSIVWGDVYWFHFGFAGSNQYTIAGPRPCVIVSDVDTLVGRTVVVCPITGAEHVISGYDYHVRIDKCEFNQLDKDSIVKVDHLYNIDRHNLIDEHYIGTLPLGIMNRIYLQMLHALNIQKILY